MTSLAPTSLDDTGSRVADGIFPRQLRHEAGELLIEREPRSIAVISTGQLDCATTLGLVPVAATQGHGTGTFEPYLTYIYPRYARALGSLTDLGDRKAPDLNVFRALKPDLIFMNLAGDRQENYAALAEIAPVVVTRGKGFNWQVDFLLMAQALGRAGQAQAFLDRFHADSAAARPRQETISFVQSNGRRLTVMGRQSFVGTIAEDMGLIRPVSQRFDATSKNLEPHEIDAVDADWIVYAGQGTGLDMIRSMPGWADLAAVRAGRAVEVDYQPFFNNAGATAARIVLDQLIGLFQE
ncbi:ABC transporter substrate-binding protein [Devosia sp.]|uniref:ABC transporter substrate-binding protein n=1 Tax=Devosia sp. TaxID=1871048 RepID=UPI001ACC344B|nr:ABC transporter substrate-binding protein [Devosia sp.]MBN9334273.1 ABC transporter substrate-binding protein [Devosia sp.]